jgi:hypothetical protein
MPERAGCIDKIQLRPSRRVKIVAQRGHRRSAGPPTDEVTLRIFERVPSTDSIRRLEHGSFERDGEV